jgi:hypothetical protein
MRQRSLLDWIVWIQGLLAIPIAILTGLAVGPIKKWYQGLGKPWETARKERAERHGNQAIFFIQNPHRFTEFLIIQAIQIIYALGVWIAGMIMMVFGVVMDKGILDKPEHVVAGIGFVGGECITVVGIVLFMARYREFSAQADFVKHFREIAKIMQDIKADEINPSK